jgi:hypothetical protein
MSPIGGVGINLAIQDAVAAANILVEPLRNRAVTTQTLDAVQKRRLLPTRIVQSAQLLLQNRVIGPALRSPGELKPPLVLKLMRLPVLRNIPGRWFGLGIRPEPRPFCCSDYAASSALIRNTVPTPACSSRAIRRMPLPAASADLIALTLPASASSSDGRPRHR